MWPCLCIGSTSAIFSSPVFDPPEKEPEVSLGVSAGSFPEQRLVIEPGLCMEIIFCIGWGRKVMKMKQWRVQGIIVESLLLISQIGVLKKHARQKK